MTMFESSQPTLFPETELPSMSSAGASRAKTSPSLASALASKVRDLVSGASMPDSLASYDPASSSWRTSQACFLSGWVEFSETFPRSGTMRRGIVSQLVPSAPLTGVIGSGSWPTPQAMDANKGNQPPRPWDMGVSLPQRVAQAMLPTPSATSYGSNQGGAAGRVGKVRPSLDTMARKGMWPTPRANDPEKRGNFNPYDPRTGLAGAVKLWPTPTANCSTGAGHGGRDGGLKLQTAVAFAKPTSRDWRSGKASPETMAKNSRPLSEQVGGSLNPTWVEWLMGFPLGWTVCEPSETPSSRRSRK